MTSSRDIEKEEQEKWFSCLTLNMDAINDVMVTFHMTNFWNDPSHNMISVWLPFTQSVPYCLLACAADSYSLNCDTCIPISSVKTSHFTVLRPSMLLNHCTIQTPTVILGKYRFIIGSNSLLFIKWLW